MGPEVARGRTLLKRAKMFVFCHRRGRDRDNLSSVFLLVHTSRRYTFDLDVESTYG